MGSIRPVSGPLFACALAALTMLGTLAPKAAHAASFTYTLDVLVNGDQPAGTIAATFEDLGVDSVRLTLDAGGMPVNQFVDTWLFNFDPDASVTGLTFVFNAGLSTVPAAAGVLPSLAANAFGNNQGVTGFGNNSSGLFDIRFDFPSPNAQRFKGGQMAVYDISGTGFDASSFDVVSAPRYNANGPYYSAAHIQGISAPGNSGAIGNNTGSGTTVVPEPASAVLALLGLGGGVGFARARRRARPVGAPENS